MITVNGAPQFEPVMAHDFKSINEKLREWAHSRTCEKCCNLKIHHRSTSRISWTDIECKSLKFIFNDEDLDPKRFSCADFEAKIK